MIVTNCLTPLAQRLGGKYTEHAKSLGCVVGGRLVAGTTYDEYNGRSMQMSIWVESRPTAEWSRAIFTYPFDDVGVHKLIGLIFGDNAKSIRLAERSGFVLEATLKDVTLHGDLLMYTMTRDQCRVLNADKWCRK